MLLQSSKMKCPRLSTKIGTSAKSASLILSYTVWSPAEEISLSRDGPPKMIRIRIYKRKYSEAISWLFSREDRMISRCRSIGLLATNGDSSNKIGVLAFYFQEIDPIESRAFHVVCLIEGLRISYKKDRAATQINQPQGNIIFSRQVEGDVKEAVGRGIGVDP